MEQNQTYTCPMHPEIARDHPGKCPLCGMDLVPVKTQSDQHTSHQKPDHSQSGTQLVKELKLKEAKKEYTCPMHPEIVRHELEAVLFVVWNWFPGSRRKMVKKKRRPIGLC
ncbi:MAG: heavy metal-binding domain-containing protein [Bacteroidota bacterium]